LLYLGAEPQLPATCSLVVDLQIASGRKTPIARDQVSETLRNGGIKFDQDLLVETGTSTKFSKHG